MLHGVFKACGCVSASTVLLSSRHCVCAAADEETVGGRAEQQPVGLLAGISMAVLILVAAAGIFVYMYNHPTSSVSLFFMEVSVHIVYNFNILRRGEIKKLLLLGLVLFIQNLKILRL